MRAAEEIRSDVERVAQEIVDNDHRGELLRKQLAHLFLQTRQHPELSMEEVRQIPARQISRQTAYELAKEAESPAGSAGTSSSETSSASP